MNRRWLLLFLLLSPAALLARADEDEVEEEAVVDDEGRQLAKKNPNTCLTFVKNTLKKCLIGLFADTFM